jgi:hypothetical protein
MDKKVKNQQLRKLQLCRETLAGLDQKEIRRVVGGLPQSDFCTQYRHGIGTC